jgi:hypothetical protein
MLSAALAVSATGVTMAAAGTSAAKSANKDACALKSSKWERDKCEKFTHSAPGDEYFGRMKMSYLGINNTFRDEAIRAGAYTTDSNIINKVHFADEAMQQWAQRYPNDPQLARSYFLGETVYKKIYTKEAQERAFAIMQTLVHKFPTSFFGKTVKQNLAIGFTEHYFALAQMCPTPMPTGVVAVTTPDASPTPAPSPKPGQPKVDIITPPCVQPSPVPSASLVPAGTTGPSAAPSPAATASAAPTTHPR